jgi:hypothetical protein
MGEQSMNHTFKGVSAAALALGAVLMAGSSMAAAQVTFDCGDGAQITNGAQVQVNVRPGDYRVTIVGTNGFDPVVAVANDAGEFLCADDTIEAQEYQVAMPTGQGVAATTSAQFTLTNTGANNFENFYITIGGFGGMGGDFFLIFEGMAVTSADGSGDPFVFTVDPGVAQSEFGAITAYAIGQNRDLDPLIFLGDGDANVIEADGVAVYCDDGGNADLCYGTGENMTGAFVANGVDSVTADELDSMLYVPVDGFNQVTDIIFYLTSYQNSTSGDYLAVFHMGVSPTGGAQSSNGQVNNNNSFNSNNNNNTNNSNNSSTNNTTEQFDFTPLNDEVIEITCQDSVFGADEERELFLPGDIVWIECPSNCAGEAVWGTDLYTDDSLLCVAGIHAGAISTRGGEMLMLVTDGVDSYEGSTRNGVTTQDENQPWPRSVALFPMSVLNGSTSNTNNSTNNSNNNSSNTNNSNNNTSSNPGFPELSYGDSINGEIGFADGDGFQFAGRQGDVITIQLDSTAFDPLVVLLDADRNEITRDDDSGVGFGALIQNFRLPADGIYVIGVLSSEAARTGAEMPVGAAYTLSLTSR